MKCPILTVLTSLFVASYMERCATCYMLNFLLCAMSPMLSQTNFSIMNDPEVSFSAYTFTAILDVREFAKSEIAVRNALALKIGSCDVPDGGCRARAPSRRRASSDGTQDGTRQAFLHRDRHSSTEMSLRPSTQTVS